MALQATGSIGALNLNTEILHPQRTTISLNDYYVRLLTYNFRTSGPPSPKQTSGNQISFADLYGREHYGGVNAQFYQIFTSSYNGFTIRDPNIDYVHIWLAGGGGGGGASTWSTGPFIKGVAASGGGGAAGLTYTVVPGQSFNQLGPVNIVLGGGGGVGVISGDGQRAGGSGSTSSITYPGGVWRNAGGGGGGGSQNKWQVGIDRASGAGGVGGFGTYTGGSGGPASVSSNNTGGAAGGGGAVRFSPGDNGNGAAGGFGGGAAVTSYAVPSMFGTYLDNRGLTRILNSSFNGGAGSTYGGNGGRGAGGGGGCGSKSGAGGGVGGGGFCIIMYAPSAQPYTF
jgi:hypothetical protein